MGHRRVSCPHGVIVEQCRCPGPITDFSAPCDCPPGTPESHEWTAVDYAMPHRVAVAESIRDDSPPPQEVDGCPPASIQFAGITYVPKDEA